MAQLLPMSLEMMASRGSAGLDRAPGLARRHAVRLARARVARSRWCRDRRPRGPCRTAPAARPTWCVWISALRSSRPGVAGAGRELRQDAARATSLASPQMPTATGLVSPMRSALMSTWMIFGRLRPVVDAVAGQRRERVEPRAQRQHHVGLGDQLHRGPRAVVAERADGERMAAREAVVVLVVVADRRIQPFGQRHAVRDGAASTTPAPDRITGNFASRQQPRRLGDRLRAAGRTLELDDRRQLDVDHLASRNRAGC